MGILFNGSLFFISATNGSFRLHPLPRLADSGVYGKRRETVKIPVAKWESFGGIDPTIWGPPVKGPLTVYTWRRPGTMMMHLCLLVVVI